MPNTKEKGKLIEVLSKHIPYGYAELCLIAEELMAEELMAEELMAEELMAEGVTVQQWISVKDRLPDNICPVLVSLEGISTAFNGWYQDGKWWTVGAGTRPFTQKVTHWMPLPQPPKGE